MVAVVSLMSEASAQDVTRKAELVFSRAGVLLAPPASMKLLRARRLSNNSPIFALTIACTLIAVSAAWLQSKMPDPTPVALTLGNVAQAEVVEIRDHAGSTVLSGEFRSRRDVLGNIEKDAALTDRLGSRVIGEIELEVPAPNRSDRRPELEVDILGLQPRSSFTVVIDDRLVASFMTDDRGSIDQELQEGEVVPPPAPAAATP